MLTVMLLNTENRFLLLMKLAYTIFHLICYFFVRAVLNLIARKAFVLPISSEEQFLAINCAEMLVYSLCTI